MDCSAAFLNVFESLRIKQIFVQLVMPLIHFSYRNIQSMEEEGSGHQESSATAEKKTVYE